MKKRRNITISEDWLKVAINNARKRGLPFSQYIERLIIRDFYDPEELDKEDEE